MTWQIIMGLSLKLVRFSSSGHIFSLLPGSNWHELFSLERFSALISLNQIRSLFFISGRATVSLKSIPGCYMVSDYLF